MADTIWTNGNADRDIDNNANWSGVKPAANDTVNFLSDYTGLNTGPNVNMANLTAIDCDEIYVGEGFTEDIGGNGNDFDISSDKVWYRGSGGKYWLKDGAGTTDWVIVDSMAPDPTTSVMNVTGATVAKLDILRGGATVDSGGTVTNTVIGSQSSPATDANLTLDSGSTVTLAEQYAGIVTSSSTIATGRIMSGTWTQNVAVFSTAIYVFGGHVNLNFAGVYPIVHHYGGTIDVTRSGGRKTFSAYYYYPTATLISTPELLTVTAAFPAVVGTWT